MTPRFDVFQDVAGNFRWRLIAGNGEKVASSGEAFANRSNALRAAKRVAQVAPQASMPPDMAALLRRR
jgi:uncharacterized protein YegP (UPF0339 family)